MTCLGTITRHTAAVLFAAACLGSTTTSAFADSYDLYKVGFQNAGEAYVIGIDSTGQALFYNTNTSYPAAYTLYDHGAPVASGNTVPASFVANNGSACTVAYGGKNYSGKCNAGYEAFSVIQMGGIDAVYAGQNGTFTAIDAGEGVTGTFVAPQQLYLDSFGDVAFNDIAVSKDQSFQAYNTTTPEPSSYVLLLTGVGLAFATHRRLLS